MCRPKLLSKSVILWNVCVIFAVLLQAVLPSAVLTTHSALVNADLCRELISVTKQLEELRIRHKYVNCSCTNMVYFCSGSFKLCVCLGQGGCFCHISFCFFCCLSAALLKNLWSNFREILGRGRRHRHHHHHMNLL